MPKPRKNEKVCCPYFAWRLSCRQGVWYADGRSNTPDAGRHSLGTFDREEALRLLPQLDQARAEALGLAAASTLATTASRPLSLAEGRRLYEEYVTRPRFRKRDRLAFAAIIRRRVPCSVDAAVEASFPVRVVPWPIAPTPCRRTVGHAPRNVGSRPPRFAAR
jgi:hypothetical protein